MTKSRFAYRFTFAALAAGLAFSLGACSTASPGGNPRDEGQSASTVLDATVLSAREIMVDGPQPAAGAEDTAPKKPVVLGTPVAIAGDVISSLLQHKSTKEKRDEIHVQLGNGQRRVVVQAKSTQVFQPGDSVILVESAGGLRVMKPVAR